MDGLHAGTLQGVEPDVPLKWKTWQDACLPKLVISHIMASMKKRIGATFLFLICVGLGVVLVAVERKAAQERRARADEIYGLSNSLVTANSKLGDEQQRSTTFEKDLAETKKALADLTNSLVQVSANLSQASTDLAKTEAVLKAKEDEIKKRDARISELETQNLSLDKRAMELGSSITNLNVQIEDTKRRLAASEGDKAILETSLKRLIAEKAELERQFNDVTILRTQLGKLKQELTIARRLDWIRLGLFASGEQKGAQKLMQGVNPLSVLARAPKPNYDLNVEVGSDGSVKVIPPLSTNRPPSPEPAPK
jgi:septal ring factor EnvC (AmiA/AmiB activator)